MATRFDGSFLHHPAFPFRVGIKSQSPCIRQSLARLVLTWCTNLLLFPDREGREVRVGYSGEAVHGNDGRKIEAGARKTRQTAHIETNQNTTAIAAVIRVCRLHMRLILEPVSEGQLGRLRTLGAALVIAQM